MRRPAAGIPLEQFEQAQREGKVWCSGHQGFLSSDQFHKRGGNRAGFQPKCKKCTLAHHRPYQLAWQRKNRAHIKQYMREYRAANPQVHRQANLKRYHALPAEQKRSLLRKNVLRKYGLSEAGYRRLLQAQGGVCAICCRPPRKNRSLAVDHCHKSQRVRSLLCNPCNLIIGLLETRPADLVTYLDYLKKHGVVPPPD